MKATKETLIRIKEWQKDKTCQITIRLNKENDKDILKKLNEVENKSGYIKTLIRADMADKKKK